MPNLHMKQEHWSLKDLEENNKHLTELFAQWTKIQECVKQNSHGKEHMRFKDLEENNKSLQHLNETMKQLNQIQEHIKQEGFQVHQFEEYQDFKQEVTKWKQMLVHAKHLEEENKRLKDLAEKNNEFNAVHKKQDIIDELNKRLGDLEKENWHLREMEEHRKKELFLKEKEVQGLEEENKRLKNDITQWKAFEEKVKRERSKMEYRNIQDLEEYKHLMEEIRIWKEAFGNAKHIKDDRESPKRFATSRGMGGSTNSKGSRRLDNLDEEHDVRQEQLEELYKHLREKEEENKRLRDENQQWNDVFRGLRRLKEMVLQVDHVQQQS